MDFSECALGALDQAIALADRLGYAVDILHVWQPPPINPTSAPFSVESIIPQAAGEQLDTLLDGMERTGVKFARGRLELGDPAEVIVRVASEGSFRLIVMGTHGRRGLSRLLWGSVAESVTRRAPCPVLTVRTGDRPVLDVPAREVRHAPSP